MFSCFWITPPWTVFKRNRVFKYVFILIIISSECWCIDMIVFFYYIWLISYGGKSFYCHLWKSQIAAYFSIMWPWENDIFFYYQRSWLCLCFFYNVFIFFFFKKSNEGRNSLYGDELYFCLVSMGLLRKIAGSPYLTFEEGQSDMCRDHL